MENPDGSFIRSHYDAQGNRIAQVTPFDSVAYGFDNLNRMSTVAGNNSATHYYYNAVGNRDSVINSNGTSTGYVYDNLNRIIKVSNYGPSGIISSYSYTLNNAGIRTVVTESDGSNVVYGYDEVYKLLSEVRNGAHPYAISYIYDNVGNRLSQTKAGATTSYTYNNRDQLMSEISSANSINYAYDKSGRQTSKTDATGTATYGWEDNDRMVQVSGPSATVSYAYDHNGQRVSESSAATTKKYLIDYQLPYGQVISETDANGNLAVNYVYGLDRISMSRGGNTFTYSADGQGSIRQLTNSSGAVTDAYWYTAFGTELAKTGTTQNTYQFVAEVFDANCGFYYNRARWYNPTIGRFTGVDPYEGDPQSPVSLHRYLYGNASPVSMSDPSGKFSFAATMYVSALVGILASVTVPSFNFGSKGFGKTDRFSLQFTGGAGGALCYIGPYLGLTFAKITERQPSRGIDKGFVAQTATYNIALLGLGFGGGVMSYASPIDFETPIKKKASDFQGIGNISVFLQLGLSIYSIGTGTIILPEGTPIFSGFDSSMGVDLGLSGQICLAYWSLVDLR